MLPVVAGACVFDSCSFSFREGAKIDLAQAQKKLRHWQKKANFEDGLVTRLEAIRETLLNANQIHLERELQQGLFVHRCSSLCSSLLDLGATLVDRVPILATQEQKQSVIEYQRKAQFDARMQSAKPALATLITPSPSLVLQSFFLLFPVLRQGKFLSASRRKPILLHL